MSKKYLAVDIGASSGRHIIGTLNNGKMEMKELYRFPNGMDQKDGHLCWDTQRLFNEIISGMKECAKNNLIPDSIGIDTWAVDYVLLDKNNNIVGPTVGYRDSRTEGIDQDVYKLISEKDLYARTGIQKQPFNTIYQLMALKKQNPEYLEQADTMLMIPDYLHFLLTGKKCVEYTNASTTQLVSPETKDWDWELIDILGLPRKIFPEIKKAGTILGPLLPAIAKEVGFEATVTLPATHDTGSAVLAVPSTEENSLYISSGTWSLLGIEIMKADCSENSQKNNFTNEGGYDYRFRYLKNIMGLWMIQSLKKELEKTDPAGDYSFANLCNLAEKSGMDSIVDCQAQCFLAPASMTQAVKDFCQNSGQAVPETAGDLARVIYRSLAACYRDAIHELSEHTGISFSTLHIVGGGANADFLNKLTCDTAKINVQAGPTEATAIGNLTVQMLSNGEFKDLTAARTCIRDSFDIKFYNN